MSPWGEAIEMSQQSYKTLTVYQDAKQLVIKVYQLLKLFPLEEKFALCDQIRRAVISVPSNIVEGMSRTSNKEKVHFLDIAYASMLEMDSQLDISKDLGFISEEQYKDIHSMVCTIGRQLNGLRQWAQPHSNTSAKPT